MSEQMEFHNELFGWPFCKRPRRPCIRSRVANSVDPHCGLFWLCGFVLGNDLLSAFLRACVKTFTRVFNGLNSLVAVVQ